MVAVQERFRALAGRPAERVCSAPARVNLIGEHTDYNGGLALPFAVGWRCRVAVAARSDGRLRAWSLQRPQEPVEVDLADARAGSSSGWPAYAVGCAAVAGTAGADLVVDSDVPAGGGLSSSAALSCAALLALHQLARRGEVDRAALAREAQRVEHEFAGVPCGLLDQTAILQARRGRAVLFDAAEQSATLVPLQPARAGLAVLLVDTGVRHDLAAGEYTRRRAQCAQAALELGVASLRAARRTDVERLPDPLLRRRARHVVSEDERVREAAAALRAGALREVGPLLTASHRSLQADFEVSCVELDTAVAACLAAGALGARLTGAGFGGCAVALVAAGRVERVRAAVAAAFADSGFAPPRVVRVSACGGARREPLSPRTPPHRSRPG